MIDDPSPVVEVLQGLGESDTTFTGMTFVPITAARGLVGDDEPARALARCAAELNVDLVFVPGSEPWAAEAVNLLRDDGRTVAWTVHGPLGHALAEHGFSEGLRLTAWDPEELQASLDMGTSMATNSIARGVAAGAELVVVADDLASSTGPLVSPDYVNEHVLQRLALLVEVAATDGLQVIIHSDGDVRAFLQSFVRAGFLALHGGGGLHPDLFESLLAEARFQGLGMIGGITTSVLGADHSTAAALGAQMGALAHGGGLVVADDGGMTESDELRSLMVALKVAKQSERTGQ